MLIYIGIITLPILFYPLLGAKRNCKFLSIYQQTTGIRAIQSHCTRRYLAYTLMVLFFLSTLRSSTIGTDFGGYVRIFQQNTGWYRDSEFLFGILNKIAYQLFGGSYIGLSFCINLIIFIPLYLHLKNHTSSRYVFVCLMIFVLNPYMYLQTTFNIVRQGCATGILILSVSFMQRKQWLRYLLIIIAAYCFHKVSAVFLLFIPAQYVKWNRKRLYCLATVMFVASVSIKGSSFMSYLMKLFKFGSYADYQTSRFDFFLFSLFLYLIICLLLINYPHLYRNNQDKFFVDMYLLSLCALLLLIKNDGAYRIYIILLFLFLPAVEVIIKNLKPTKYRGFALTGYITYYACMLAVFFYSIMGTPDQPYYVPFQFFFQ